VLEAKVMQYKKREKVMREQIVKEQERRKEAEINCAAILGKAKELNAY